MAGDSRAERVGNRTALQAGRAAAMALDGGRGGRFDGYGSAAPRPAEPWQPCGVTQWAAYASSELYDARARLLTPSSSLPGDGQPSEERGSFWQPSTCTDAAVHFWHPVPSAVHAIRVKEWRDMRSQLDAPPDAPEAEAPPPPVWEVIGSIEVSASAPTSAASPNYPLVPRQRKRPAPDAQPAAGRTSATTLAAPVPPSDDSALRGVFQAGSSQRGAAWAAIRSVEPKRRRTAPSAAVGGPPPAEGVAQSADAARPTLRVMPPAGTSAGGEFSAALAGGQRVVLRAPSTWDGISWLALSLPPAPRGEWPTVSSAGAWLARSEADGAWALRVDRDVEAGTALMARVDASDASDGAEARAISGGVLVVAPRDLTTEESVPVSLHVAPASIEPSTLVGELAPARAACYGAERRLAVVVPPDASASTEGGGAPLLVRRDGGDESGGSYAMVDARSTGAAPGDTLLCAPADGGEDGGRSERVAHLAVTIPPAALAGQRLLAHTPSGAMVTFVVPERVPLNRRLVVRLRASAAGAPEGGAAWAGATAAPPSAATSGDTRLANYAL